MHELTSLTEDKLDVLASLNEFDVSCRSSHGLALLLADFATAKRFMKMTNLKNSNASAPAQNLSTITHWILNIVDFGNVPKVPLKQTIGRLFHR